MKAGLEEIKATVMARQDKVKAPISSDWYGRDHEKMSGGCPIIINQWT
jgi:hypothetical protein